MKSKRLIPIVLTLVLLTTGCWNRIELEDIALIIAMGVDKVKPGLYRVTFQEVNPSGVAQQQTGGGQAVPVRTFSGTGPTFLEAARKASRKISRRLFAAHTRLMVIGEAMAREGIGDPLDIFQRDNELRINTIVLIAKGKAETVLNTLTPVTKIPALSLTKSMERTQERWGENIEVDIQEVVKALASEGRDPAISGVFVAGKPEEGSKIDNVNNTKPPTHPVISGVAMFKGDRLTHWIKGHEARGLLWILDKIQGTAVNLTCRKEKKTNVVEVFRSKTCVQAEPERRKPKIRIKIEPEAQMEEVHCHIDLNNPEEITRLEKQMEKVIQKEVEATVKTAQKQRSDIFGFGEVIRRADPKTWKKLKKNWRRQFAKTDVDVEVEASIRHTNRIKKPMTIRKG
jgi:spore germination protein KC